LTTLAMAKAKIYSTGSTYNLQNMFIVLATGYSMDMFSITRQSL